MNKTIRDIALEAPATTRVFEEFKIDYCCGGRRSIEDVCSSSGIDPQMLIERIETAIIDSKGQTDRAHPEDRSPTDLVDTSFQSIMFLQPRRLND